MSDELIIDSRRSITENITLTDRDMSPAEMASVMRQVARVVSFLIGTQLAYSAINKTPGAGATPAQKMFAVAATAEMAAMELDPPRLMPPSVMSMQGRA